MRTFTLLRLDDPSGVSGTGTVAEGVEFSDGRCALRWVAPGVPSGTGTYDSIQDVLCIHGHGGATRVVWTEDASRQPTPLTRVAEIMGVSPSTRFS